MKILLVDDQVVMRTLFRRIVGASNYDFLEAANGLDALRQLEENSDVGVVILDQYMPLMTGMEFLVQKNCRKDLQKIPVVLMSANQTPELVQQGIGLGVQLWIEKPFKRQNIERVIATAIGGFST